MIKAVIFDVDGVLVDSEKIYEERRNIFFKRENILVSEDLQKSFRGSNADIVFQTLFPSSDSQQKIMKEKYELYKKTYKIDYSKLLDPEVKFVFSNLKKEGIKIGIASSSPMVILQNILSLDSLYKHVDVTLSGCDFKETKPNPEIYEKMVEKLGCNKDEIIVIEDSEIGILAGKRANLTVLALYTEGVDQTLADRIINTLIEILDIIT